MSTARAVPMQGVKVTPDAAQEFRKRLIEPPNLGKAIRVVFQGYA